MNKQAIRRHPNCFQGLLWLCTSALLSNLAQAVLAAPPPNDTCAGAEVIPANGPFPHLTVIRDISSATTNGDPAAPSCITYSPTNLSRSVWYSFKPSASARYLISSCSDAPTATTVDDTVMAIYSTTNGCVGPLLESPGGCDDDTCGRNGLQAAITADLKATSNYFIVVWRYGTDVPLPDNSSLQLLIEPAIPPPNDTCQTATPLLLNQPVRGRTSLASNFWFSSARSKIAVAQTPFSSSRATASNTRPRCSNKNFRTFPSASRRPVVPSQRVRRAVADAVPVVPAQRGEARVEAGRRGADAADGDVIGRTPANRRWRFRKPKRASSTCGISMYCACGRNTSASGAINSLNCCATVAWGPRSIAYRSIRWTSIRAAMAIGRETSRPPRTFTAAAFRSRFSRR